MPELVSTVWVTNPENQEPVAFGPGDTVPKWAAEQMGPHCFAAGDESALDDLTVDDLKSEIDSRNKGRSDDDKLSKSGTKADLIDALKADG